jgi:hypothetical protein
MHAQPVGSGPRAPPRRRCCAAAARPCFDILAGYVWMLCEFLVALYNVLSCILFLTEGRTKRGRPKGRAPLHRAYVGGLGVHGPERSGSRATAAVAIFAATALLLAACSPGNYPEVLAPPTPRGGDPMTPDQVKQATDALVCDRDQLSAEAQGTPQTAAQPNAKAGASASPAGSPTNTTGNAVRCAQTAGVANKP